jgi:hypothetical protein
MSAAATAAGYLYASGRLRGRGAREQEESQGTEESKRPREEKKPEKKLRVAVYQPEQRSEKPAAPRRQPKIEYRVRRRWTPE